MAKTTQQTEDEALFDDSPEAIRKALDSGANKGPDSSAARLKSYLERIERLKGEKQGIADDIKEVFAEAKGTGFDVKIMRLQLKRRAMEAADRSEQDELLELYERAAGDRL